LLLACPRRRAGREGKGYPLVDSRIREYLAAVEALKAGRFDADLPTEGGDDVGRLGSALRELGLALRRRLGVSDLLTRIGEEVNSGLVLDDVLDSVYDSFRSVIPYDRIGVALLEEQGTVVRARWARSEARELRIGRGYSASLEGSSLGRVISTGEARILGDLEAYLAEHPDSDSTRRVVEEGMRSSLTCPLVALGRRVGFLFFSSLRKHAYGEEHRALFHRIAVQLSVVIEKSRLYEDLLAANRRLETLASGLEYHAAHDTLTTIWNRGAIMNLLGREQARARREGRSLAVLLADIDHFKRVNDTHGHAVGDAVLHEVARRLESGLRSAEVVGRYGGDEFMVVLYPCRRENATVVMERLRRQVAARPVSTTAGAIPTTISVGAAVAEAPLDPDQIIEAADQALYSAKQGGRNRVELIAAADRSPVRPRPTPPPRAD
jgi:diguanylate cyclase (GGDEF)-like protein